jgi:very-short-patch-repair endonuclease
MPKKEPTPQVRSLVAALEKRGIKAETEHWDGHKHIDIYVPAARLYLEVDGLPHYTDAERFLTDLKRDHYSDDDGFFTKRIPNELVETHLEAIADAITPAVERA